MLAMASSAFQSTRPSRGETSQAPANTAPHNYFNPLAPRGARQKSKMFPRSSFLFQSTRPSRGETYVIHALLQQVHISIHSPLAGRDTAHQSTWARCDISIHSPLAGRDKMQEKISELQNISIHSPLAGRDIGGDNSTDVFTHFNPLAPRGARRDHKDRHSPGINFNPLAPRGARPFHFLIDTGIQKISIHSPLAGRD